MHSTPNLALENEVITVSELNRSARQALERAIPLIWVAGEISNLTRAASGHWYFSLKDDKAQVKCVMFRHKNQYMDWAPENGMQVEIRSLVTLYEPRGDFQLNAEAMRRSGLGALFEAFEKLKSRLSQEGLFDAEHKKPLPAIPGQIGVITSKDAAALRDVLTTLRRRMPGIPVVIYHTPVQGEGAAQRIADAIHIAAQRNECDVLILCRGGGSIEDLWQFNQEVVARAIFESAIPIVCGVGHETDITIADFVADERAPTPTAAAELVAPNRLELLQKLETTNMRLYRMMGRVLEVRMQHLDHISRRLVTPSERLNNRQTQLQHLQQYLQNAFNRQLNNTSWELKQIEQRLLTKRPDIESKLTFQKNLTHRLQQTMTQQLESTNHTLQRLTANLLHLNPQSVLDRGYSITQTASGNIVRSSTEVNLGDILKITLAKGSLTSEVTEKNS
ncbi:exodeoxyribonuclease VII large subunit [Sulfurirhabdus autotrophica]|uniref:Exodeoxyribonuclease 7 large subunit n=1 Tax=Sulfurirhabdus autotrophica TaxID=1706046 RepID=A0A4R3Y1G9_9PROT|nr:exodeoxyribonuclease VII large subunit [Sulfurirhabdus autotrophica]TCV85357.1 exodeoxyribonuclease VII large subunit [Sulfurirhabdus autotrophica]